jgi:hypothetical protein
MVDHLISAQEKKKMKVTVKHGVDTKFDIEVPDGATVETVLKDNTVVTVCGEHGAARVNSADAKVDTLVKEGDVLEPVTVANEKAA